MMHCNYDAMHTLACVLPTQEKGKGRSPGAFVLHPAQTFNFTTVNARPVLPPPTGNLKPLNDVFTTDVLTTDKRGSSEAVPEVEAPLTSQEPLHFCIGANNLAKASRSLRDAIRSREVLSPDSEEDDQKKSPVGSLRRTVKKLVPVSPRPHHMQPSTPAQLESSFKQQPVTSLVPLPSLTDEEGGKPLHHRIPQMSMRCLSMENLQGLNCRIKGVAWSE